MSYRYGGKARPGSQVQGWLPRGSFNPANLNLKLWLDASDSTTITSSGSPAKVSQWNDKSANGFNFTQGTGAAQPTTGATTQNGLNVLDFAGAQSMANGTASNFLFTVDGSSYLLAAVWKAGTSSNPNAVYGLIGSSGTVSQTGFYTIFDDRASASRNENFVYAVFNGPSTTAVTNAFGNSTHPPNKFVTVSLLADPDNGTALDRAEGFVTNSYGLKTNVSTGAVAASVTNTTTIGSVVGSLTGSIAEIIMVEGVDANETNRVLLRDYLSAKWGVT